MNGYKGCEFNEAITLMGDVQITLNREKLANILYDQDVGRSGYMMLWNSTTEELRNVYRRRANAILNDLPELLEVVK